MFQTWVNPLSFLFHEKLVHLFFCQSCSLVMWIELESRSFDGMDMTVARHVLDEVVYHK
jgi:hypothetical protein